jgi:hypothetical protein
MKRVPLSQGMHAAVDDHRFDEIISMGRWHAYWNPESFTFYARRNGKWLGGGVREKPILLHRVIRGAPDGIDVDHEDGDGLNCQGENLRLASPSQNAANARAVKSGGYSRYKGVTWIKRLGRWYAQIGYHGRKYYLGLHDTEEEAAFAYNIAAQHFFGRFARLNELEEAA